MQTIPLTQNTDFGTTGEADAPQAGKLSAARRRGAVAAKILGELGISVKAYTRQIGPVSISPECFCLEDREKNRLYMPDQEAAREAEQFLEEKMAQKIQPEGLWNV